MKNQKANEFGEMKCHERGYLKCLYHERMIYFQILWRLCRKQKTLVNEGEAEMWCGDETNPFKPCPVVEKCQVPY